MLIIITYGFCITYDINICYYKINYPKDYIIEILVEGFIFCF